MFNYFLIFKNYFWNYRISNLGMYGIHEFSAIINPPQCAILAVGGSRIEIGLSFLNFMLLLASFKKSSNFLYLICKGDDGKPFTAMTTTLSYDEDAISSSAAATFMSTLRSLLESPGSMLVGHRT